MENNKLDKRTKWSYCIGATGRDMAYALVSMFLLTYIQYTMKLTVAQYAVISAIMVVCLLWDAINDPMMGICRIFWSGISFMGNDLHNE